LQPQQQRSSYKRKAKLARGPSLVPRSFSFSIQYIVDDLLHTVVAWRLVRCAGDLSLLPFRRRNFFQSRDLHYRPVSKR